MFTAAVVTDTSIMVYMLSLVAQLDARPTGDQEVAGSTPAGSATFFTRDLIMNIF